MAAFEVAQTVGGDDIADTIGVSTPNIITIGAMSGDSRISQDYDHLYFVFSNRSGNTTYYENLKYEFNDQSLYKYSYTLLYTSTATVSTTREGTADSIRAIQGDYIQAGSTLANTFGVATMWIPHYANTTNFTQTFSRSVVANNSVTDNQWAIRVVAGLYGETDPITQIQMTCGSAGQEFQQYSSYVLYGITGA